MYKMEFSNRYIVYHKSILEQVLIRNLVRVKLIIIIKKFFFLKNKNKRNKFSSKTIYLDKI